MINKFLFEKNHTQDIVSLFNKNENNYSNILGESLHNIASNQRQQSRMTDK